MSIDRYAVMGNPIKHSKSPQIHKAFAEQTDQHMTYTSMLVPEDSFEDAVRKFFAEGGKGLNITVPFKIRAYELSDELTERAQRAKAVNTLLIRNNGSIVGDNTDGAGLVRDIMHNHDGRLGGKKILVVGAGGAVRGVLAPILAEKPALVVLTNRTFEKAHHLAEEFADLGRIEAVHMNKLQGPFNWIINGTAASLQGDIPELSESVIGEHTRVYDMMYSKQATPFNAWAKDYGAEKAFDGLGMLVEQAAESFRQWRGVMPSTPTVISDLRAAM
ncbi:shikimate dehydrogenase [Ketobacter alkanivorans]|uniref:Shikimate dehydrogenase (NADP(+)) n=1 Tax=Ketobacter alkanivorans TaxID=1917421 RepID=A0A2K9LNC9_9GAMM|nr:shikimate dehydrogenase [Ketobacter alkanivorans]